jgi:plastocyanin
MRLLRHRLLMAALAIVVLAASHACGSSYSSPMAPPPAGNADVTITIVSDNGNLSFSPNPGVLMAGQTVAWRNADIYATHQPVADGGAFNAGAIPPGSVSAPIKITTAGSYPYHCAIHPTMVGTLTVQ